MDRAEIEVFLERIGEAVTAGDAAEVARCWATPAIVLSDKGALVVSDIAEVERFFVQSIEWYRSRGLVATRPEIEHIEALGEYLTAVDVRWPGFDEAGVEKSTERSHYILLRDADGQQRIRVALTRTA